MENCFSLQLCSQRQVRVNVKTSNYAIAGTAQVRACVHACMFVCVFMQVRACVRERDRVW